MWKSAGPDVILTTEAVPLHICGLFQAASSGAKSEKLKLFSVVFHPSKLMKNVLYIQPRVTNLVSRPLQHFPQLKTRAENSHKPPVGHANIKFDIFSVDPAAGQGKKVVMKTVQLLSLQLTSLLSNFIQQTTRFA